MSSCQLVAGDVGAATSHIPDDSVPAKVSSQRSTVVHTRSTSNLDDLVKPLDVNADGHVLPIDGLLVINALRSN